jgi:predicted RND superfamily exporter protein
MFQEKKWKSCLNIAIILIFILSPFLINYPGLLFFLMLSPFIIFLSTNIKQRLAILKSIKCIFPNEDMYNKAVESLKNDYKGSFNIEVLLDKDKRDDLLQKIIEQNEKRDKIISKNSPKSKMQKHKDVVLSEKNLVDDLRNYAKNQQLNELQDFKKEKESREKIEKYLNSDDAFKSNSTKDIFTSSKY